MNDLKPWEDGVLVDRSVVRVPMTLMDSADARLRAEGVEQLLKTGTLTDEQREAFKRMPSNTQQAPGALPISDADRSSREERYIRRDQKLTNAWKIVAPLDPGQIAQSITPASSADRYAARDARLEQAWRTP